MMRKEKSKNSNWRMPGFLKPKKWISKPKIRNALICYFSVLKTLSIGHPLC
jgi:hypothetical protein